MNLNGEICPLDSKVRVNEHAQSATARRSKRQCVEVQVLMTEKGAKYRFRLPTPVKHCCRVNKREGCFSVFFFS